MRVVTTSPLFIPLELKAGIDPRSNLYKEVLAALPQDSDELTIPNRHRDLTSADFTDLNDEDYDLRLMVWTPAHDDETVQTAYHIYPNGVCIATAEFTLDDNLQPDDAETQTQDCARALIDQHAVELNRKLKDLARRIPPHMTENSPDRPDVSSQQIAWTSRAVFLTPQQRDSAAGQAFIRAWLSETHNPDDADKIIAGELDHSMSWVNYLFIETPRLDPAAHFASLRLAQFFFSAQQALNMKTQHALTEAFLIEDVRQAARSLADAREKMQFLAIQFGVQKCYLRRSQKAMFDMLLNYWEFDQLVQNGNRMIEASTAKIDEISVKRAERSTIITDIILATIGMLTVVQVSLYLTEYSRHMMSSPVMEYNDDQLSWVLSMIANVDTDTVMIGGMISVLILVGIYAYWKLRK